jgi:hypothetical protein
VADYVEDNARPFKDGDEDAHKIIGQGRVTVREDGRGGCYIKAARGDGAQLRAAVLATLAEAGLRTEPFQDYAPVVDRGDWVFLQESHCFRMYDAVYIVLISSSTRGRRTPLQVTMFRDHEDLAAGKGLCLAR